MVEPILLYLLPILIAFTGEEPTYLAEVIAAALQFNDPNDEESREIQQSIQEIGTIDTLKKIAELPEGHAILKLVEKQLN